MVKRKAFGKNNKQRNELIVIITPMAFYLYIIFVSYVRENITFSFIPILLITRSNVDQIPR